VDQVSASLARRRVVGFIAMIIAVVAVSIGGAGVAFAYWTAGGTGTGSGATGTSVPLSLSAGTPTATLLPGGQTGVVLTMTNPNLATVRISSVTLDTTHGTGGFSVDPAHSGCSLSALSFAAQTNGGAGWTVPGRVGTTNGTVTVSLANALSMTLSAVNECQGAIFTAYLLGS
jgi:hypothetical protein